MACVTAMVHTVMDMQYLLVAWKQQTAVQQDCFKRLCSLYSCSRYGEKNGSFVAYIMMKLAHGWWFYDGWWCARCAVGVVLLLPKRANINIKKSLHEN